MDTVSGVGSADEDHPIVFAAVLPTSQSHAAVGAFKNAVEKIGGVRDVF